MTLLYIHSYSVYKVVSCVFPNVCIGLAVNVISKLELRKEGLQFVDFTRSFSSDDMFNIYIVVIMLLVDSLLFMIIAW